MASSRPRDTITMEFQFLGTSSGTPSKTRNVSGLALRGPGGGWSLVDCGEGTQHRILHTTLSLHDLRGLAPRERAEVIIEQCTAEPYKSMLRAYVREARRRGGQTPHVLEQAYAWHTRYSETGSMLEP
jgi:hypothetical protein